MDLHPETEEARLPTRIGTVTLTLAKDERVVIPAWLRQGLG